MCVIFIQSIAQYFVIMLF